MTVMENLEIGARQATDDKTMEQRYDEVFSIFEVLSKRKNQKAGTLSGGEQQMLAIGRGLMALPKCLMLDEPSLGLAPNLVEFVFDIIKKISNENMTVVLVEQNIKQALKISQRGYVLENGKVKMHNTGKKLLNDKTVKEAYLSL